jgi:hypothetical protein
MNSNFAKAFAIGLGAVLVAVAIILFMQRGAHMDLPGELKVRTLSTSKDESLALLDLHISNPSDYTFTVHNIAVTLETKSGDASGTVVARSDAERLFASMPDAGPFHPTLYTDAPITAHTTADYTLAVPFSMPEGMLKDRKRMVVRIDEINGKSFEYSAK